MQQLALHYDRLDWGCLIQYFWVCGLLTTYSISGINYLSFLCLDCCDNTNHFLPWFSRLRQIYDQAIALTYILRSYWSIYLPSCTVIGKALFAKLYLHQIDIQYLAIIEADIIGTHWSCVCWILVGKYLYKVPTIRLRIPWMRQKKQTHFFAPMY